MRLKGMIFVLAVVATVVARLGIGSMQAFPAYAASAAPDIIAHAAVITLSNRHARQHNEDHRKIANRDHALLNGIAAPAPAAHKLVPSGPVGLVKSKNVDSKTTNGCGEFKGTLYYYSELVGKNYEQTFDVTGTLYDHCGSTGVSRLYAHWTCDNETPQGPKIGETTRTQSISWGSPECSYSITDMYVEVCWHNKTGGVHECAYSAKLE